MINGVKHKVIGYTYDSKPVGWIACGENANKINYGKD